MKTIYILIIYICEQAMEKGALHRIELDSFIVMCGISFKMIYIYDQMP